MHWSKSSMYQHIDNNWRKESFIAFHSSKLYQINLLIDQYIIIKWFTLQRLQQEKSCKANKNILYFSILIFDFPKKKFRVEPIRYISHRYASTYFFLFLHVTNNTEFVWYHPQPVTIHGQIHNRCCKKLTTMAQLTSQSQRKCCQENDDRPGRQQIILKITTTLIKAQQHLHSLLLQQKTKFLFPA